MPAGRAPRCDPLPIPLVRTRDRAQQVSRTHEQSNPLHHYTLDERHLSEYLKSVKRPVPHFLKKRFDDLG